MRPDYPEVPKFITPFSFETRAGVAIAKVVEQDSLEEITQCVETVIRTIKGTCIENADFGIEETTFQQIPINASRVIEECNKWEPRAQVEITPGPARSYDDLLHSLRVSIHGSEEAGATGEDT